MECESRTGDYGHPLRPVFAEKLAFGRKVFWGFESPPHDIPELVCRLFLA